MKDSQKKWSLFPITIHTHKKFFIIIIIIIIIKKEMCVYVYISMGQWLMGSKGQQLDLGLGAHSPPVLWRLPFNVRQL